MIKKNDTAQLDICDVTGEGYGVGKWRNLALQTETAYLSGRIFIEHTAVSRH